jgi:HNH endonuclease
MAQHRPSVPAAIKRALLQQTGNKCANPGCPNVLREIHHINEWAVYHTHDEENMIAICPACHDSVTRGLLTISDEELYHWKGIKRSRETLTGHLFIEPALTPTLILGHINVAGPDGVTVMELDQTKLSLTVRDRELGILNLKTVDSAGQPMLDVVDNYVRQRNAAVTINARPGRYQVATDATQAYPPWVLECLSKVPPPRNDPAHFGVLDIAVIEPGKVRVRGLLLGNDGALVADNEKVILLSRKLKVAIALVGHESVTTHFMGRIDQPMKII